MPRSMRPRSFRFGYLGLVKLFAVDGRTESVRHKPMHFAGERVALEGSFREEQLAVQLHFKAPAVTWQQEYARDPPGIVGVRPLSCT